MEDKPEDLSRLDAKIARDKLLADESENLWHEPWSTAKKLNSHCGSYIEAKLNDGNSLITASTPSRGDRGKPAVQIRFDRSENKLTAEYTDRPDRSVWKDRTTYSIKADAAEKILYLDAGPKQRYKPIDVAETVLAEKLLKMDLDS